MQLDSRALILVTGAAGRIGRAVVSALRAQKWTVRGFDRKPSSNANEFVVGDLAQLGEVQEAASGASAIIHLGGEPDDNDFMTRIVPSNIVGTHNVLEAARVNGVNRVLLASSGQVNWWQQLEGPWPIHADDPYTPRHWYAAGKIFLEAAGRAYARNYGMAVVAVRLGWCPRNREHLAELTATPRGHNTYLSPGDAGRFFVRAVEAALTPGFTVLFVTSRPVHKAIFDAEPAKQLFGWQPSDQWPTGAAEGLDES